MPKQKNILEYFDHILKTVRAMEEHAQVFSELHSVAEELHELEQYIKTVFTTLDNQFQNYMNQVNLLSGLVDFQRQILRTRNAQEAIQQLFDFIQTQVPFQHAFIYTRLSEDEQDYEILHPATARATLYRKLLTPENVQRMNRLIADRDMAILLNSLQQFQLDPPTLKKMGARMAIMFPIRLKDKFFGFGMLLGKENAFQLQHLSFVNLIVGLISLILFQHYYFFHFKRKLFKQLKYKKILEEVDYAEYLEKGPLLFFITDTRGVVLQTNRAAMQKLELDENLIIGEKFLSIIPDEHRKSFQNLMNKLKDGDIHFYKCPVTSANNEEFVFEFYLAKAQLQDDVDFIVILAVDATQQFYREQLEKRNELLDEITQFSETIYEQINSMLTLIVPNVSLIKSKLPADHPLQKNVQTVENALSQTSKILQRFLNYGLQEIEPPKEMNINDLIQSVIEEFRQKVPPHVDIQYALEPGLPTTLLYEERIKKLLRILLQNSVEAIRDKGYIKISTHLISLPRDTLINSDKIFLKQGDYIEITVEDNGMGIDPKLLPHIFKPFFSTKIKNELMGLGLFIAYNIVRDLDGEIWAKSTPGECTKFFVYIPLKGEEIMQEVVPFMEEAKVAQVSKILVVDDEYNIRSMLKEVLEMKRYEVFTAGNGKEGVEIFKRYANEIDLVILDMVMPVMDGRTAFMEIKKVKPDQKVLIISGYAQRENLEEILEKGASAFMRKPFQIEDILHKVQDILSQKN
ncbi:MAG: response regulator [Calditrichaeota bacterium]|nr:response regulator [Calditrichota bacterium]